MFKKIQLNRIIERVKKGKGFEVFVNGSFYQFPNKREALDFSRRVDGWLNDQFEQINSSLIQVYGLYRHMNAFLDPSTRVTIQNDIKEIEKSIDLTFNRSSWDSWTVTTFSKLESCLIKLEHIMKILELVARVKSYTIMKSEIRVASKLIEMLRDDYREFEIESRKYERKQNKSKYIFFKSNHS